MQEFTRHEDTGIVLSGGGVRGMAHIGLFKALREFDIHPKWVSGTSIGAIIGALFAQGVAEEEMLRFFKETPLFRYDFFSLGKPGLFDTERYYSVFETYLPHNAFEGLKIPLFVNATNLQQGTTRFFSEGELILPLLASAALPPIFSPVQIGDELYSDGGIMNNFAIEPIEGKAGYIIGSHVSKMEVMPPDAIKTSLQLANRTTELMLHAINQHKFSRCHLLFNPPALHNIGVLDKKGMIQAFDLGYEFAVRKLDQVLKTP